jgi:hypothetical protein
METPRGICQNCNEKPATQTWVGEGGTFGLVHGQYQFWCELCCVKAQIKHAEEAAARLPELREKLRVLNE